MLDNFIQELVISLEKILTSPDEMPEIKPENHILNYNLVKNVNELFHLNIPLPFPVEPMEMVFARETIKEFGYEINPITSMYARIYNSALKNDFSPDEIRKLFRVLLIKAYLSEKKSFELYQSLAKFIYDNKW